METINGCTMVRASEVPEPVDLGPSEIGVAYGLVVGSIPAGQPAPPFHVHPHTDEAFHVARGELTLLLGDREVRAGAGDLVLIPRGTPHTAWNSGDGAMLGLIVISPGDAEHVFEPVEGGAPPPSGDDPTGAKR